MAVGRDPKGKTWYFVIDLPASPDGRRRQMRRRGFASERAAGARQQEALAQFGRVELAADGTVAAESERWLDERELDLSRGCRPIVTSSGRTSIRILARARRVIQK
ncbi:Arm DNA-binding domain-containing protein [Micromonospora sp. WMMD1102]|uniref:Arm DNA-binding domain-containing protein n=1 Tax=Micromonospora sp. WMMD1102 TaxID=3016105 RepID=UPI0024151710|nr:Arm DNA-binding domain-containing protein [Micromonospora sp. WMMD1102]MDG4788984.1 Arm DNA-binding domain-containing protein [Micromonospora sp. WMMD1102]